MARRKLFDAPGKATLWGVGACLLCVAAHMTLGWIIAITILASLGGCFNG
jgi:cobalamin biosynthesis protein CobD/CbiB